MKSLFVFVNKLSMTSYDIDQGIAIEIQIKGYQLHRGIEWNEHATNNAPVAIE